MWLLRTLNVGVSGRAELLQTGSRRERATWSSSACLASRTMRRRSAAFVPLASRIRRFPTVGLSATIIVLPSRRGRGDRTAVGDGFPYRLGRLVAILGVRVHAERVVDRGERDPHRDVYGDPEDLLV